MSARSLRAAPLLLALALAGCARGSTHLAARAKLVRAFVNRTDPKTGAPLTADVEMLFEGCGEGEYRKVIRGGADFAACTSRLTPGESFDVTLEQGRRRDGRLRSRVTSFGGCPRVPDPSDTRSYDEVRVCSDVSTDGLVLGFHCEYKPTAAQLAACPFLAVR